MEFVSWDDDIPRVPRYGKITFMFQTTNQMVILWGFLIYVSFLEGSHLGIWD